MPRKARIDAPGALHHIIVRGIERAVIFKDCRDRDNFLDRLGTILSESSTACYAWVLMTNHVHLLLKTGLTPIATVMRRLLTGHAVQFNRRHKRHGHLFQNRYKSILCEEDAYLLELIRYLHLNPIRAEIVKDLNALKFYRYCGHSVIMGKTEHEWQDIDYVLGLFGKSYGAARRAYSAFVAKGVLMGRRPDLVGGGLLRSVGGWSALKGLRGGGIRHKGDERILGSSDFVKRVLKKANEQLDQKSRLQASGIDLKYLIDKVASYYEIESEDLRTASKESTITLARRMLCYLAARKLMFSCIEVARELNISTTAVSRAAKIGRRLAGRRKIQKELLNN
jgi:REP element-mobilizing transposase RayT